jgi:BirA family biotin operon repressor/biotin-[acetyl-CoA-carboxylase] ligase
MTTFLGQINKYGERAAMMPEIYNYQSIDSTNNRAKELAAQGAPHGTAVIAGTQTGGRGRYGRSFASPPGGLYMSVVLKIAGADTELMTAAAAVAVCRAVERVTGLQPRIKWVNDVLIDGKKVCGILCETVSGAEWAVAGIGVNTGAVPEEVQSIAAGLGLDGKIREALAGEILKNLLSGEEFIDEYKRRLIAPPPEGEGKNIFSVSP